MGLAGFHPGTAPAKCDGTLGIEIGSFGGRGHGLTGKDLARPHRANCHGWSYSPFATAPHKYQTSLESCASDIGRGNHRRRTVLMIRKHVIGSKQTPGEMSTQFQIKTAADQQADFVIVSEDFRCQAMLAHESFEKWRKMARAISELRPGGEVEEFDLVNSRRHPAVTAAPLATAVDCQSEPTVKVVGNGSAKAPRIPRQATVHRENCARKQAVHIAAGVESRVSAVKFPLGSRLVLRCRERAQATEDSNHSQQRDCDAAARVMRMR